MFRSSTHSHFLHTLASMILLATLSLKAHGDSVTFNVVEVAAGLYLHQGRHEFMNAENAGDINNSGFIVGDRFVAVIDPGGSHTMGLHLRHQIAKVTDLPIEYLILTHFHPDHVIGASAFRDVPHVIAHQKYSRALAQRAEFYRDRFGLFLDPASKQFIQPTMAVSEPVEIQLGNRRLLIEPYPTAHTDNDVTVLDQTTKTLWASDLVFSQRTPALDGSINGWIDVLRDLQRLPVERVVPGHGPVGELNAVIEPQLNYMLTLRNYIRSRIGAGVSLSTVLSEAVSDPAFQDLSRQLALFEPQHLSNVSKAYAEIEWE